MDVINLTEDQKACFKTLRLDDRDVIYDENIAVYDRLLQIFVSYSAHTEQECLDEMESAFSGHHLQQHIVPVVYRHLLLACPTMGIFKTLVARRDFPPGFPFHYLTDRHVDALMEMYKFNGQLFFEMMKYFFRFRGEEGHTGVTKMYDRLYHKSFVEDCGGHDVGRFLDHPFYLDGLKNGFTISSCDDVFKGATFSLFKIFDLDAHHVGVNASLICQLYKIHEQNPQSEWPQVSWKTIWGVL